MQNSLYAASSHKLATASGRRSLQQVPKTNAKLLLLLASAWVAALFSALAIGFELGAVEAGYKSVYYAVYCARIAAYLYVGAVTFRIALTGGWKWFFITPWLPYLLLFAAKGVKAVYPAVGFY